MFARATLSFSFYSLTLTLPLPTSITNEHLLYCASNLILRNKFIWSMVSTVKGLAKGIERVWTEENEWCCCCYSATFEHITVHYVSRQFIQCFSSITISFHLFVRVVLKVVCRASCAKAQMKILCEPIRITIYVTYVPHYNIVCAMLTL